MSRHHEIYRLGPPNSNYSVLLPEGTFYPSHTSSPDMRPITALRYYDRVRNKPWNEVRILDLGCNEGHSTIELGRLGSSVLGIEARRHSVRRAEFARDCLGLSNVRFKVGNVLSEKNWEGVDLVFAAGILYHLDDPIQFLELIGKYCADFVYIATHCAPETEEQVAASPHRNRFAGRIETKFGDLQIPGMRFHEAIDTDEVDERGILRGARTGFGNTESVWLSKSGVQEVLRRLGFPHFENIKSNDKALRYRFGAYRTSPGEAAAELVGPDLTALKARFPESLAIQREHDISFLKESRVPLGMITEDGDRAVGIRAILSAHGVPVTREFRANEPGLLKDVVESGLRYWALAAAPERVDRIHREVGHASTIDYVFTSFCFDIPSTGA